MRIYILSGWMGRLTSFGMATLMPRLMPYGYVTFHSWKDWPTVVTDINGRTDPTVVIGYSMGGCDLSTMETANTYPGHEHDPVLARDVDLGIAYDPRGYINAPLKAGEYVQALKRYKRLIGYHNSAPWGFPSIRYSNAEVTLEINIPHPLVQFSGWLHDYTVGEVRRLANAPK